MHEPDYRKIETSLCELDGSRGLVKLTPSSFSVHCIALLAFLLASCSGSNHEPAPTSTPPDETRGYDLPSHADEGIPGSDSANAIKVSTSTAPSGASLLCQCVKGNCQTASPIRVGSDCHCADKNGLVAGTAINAPEEEESVQLASVVDVYYGTDRERTSSSARGQLFGNTSSNTLTYGVVRVTIPPAHRTGSLEAPSTLIRLRFLENPQKHVVLLQTNVLEKNQFFSLVQDRIASSPREDAFIFVHGFNVSFEDAARRAAQIAFDLTFRGVPVFYSWPSKASPTPLGYTNDSQTIEWSRAYLKQFLDDFLRNTKAKRVHLIAHSMGTQALTDSIISLVKEKPAYRARIKEIILAAPDIDAGVFKRDIAPRLIEFGHPVTLYASSHDEALRLSHMANGRPRAGDAGQGLVLFNGIETIDASNVSTDLLGHSVFASTPELLHDWQYIVDLGLRAKDRVGLKQMFSERPYWQFKN